MIKSILRRKKFLFPPDNKFCKILKRIIGFLPTNCELYQLSFIHKSASYDIFKNVNINNERLEYLGDAVLDIIVADYLYEKYPDKGEGFLTQMRSKIVNRENINHIAIKLGIPNIILSNISSDNYKSVYGDALEALIGAIYLDKGFIKAKKFIIERIIKNHVNLLKLQEAQTDFKSKIIEWAQKNKKDISFSTFEENDSPSKSIKFITHLLLINEIIGKGSGSSKKEAEQNAAKQAIEHNNTP